MIPEEQLDDVTRGEARNYDHRGHHHFRTGLSTLKTVALHRIIETSLGSADPDG